MPLLTPEQIQALTSIGIGRALIRGRIVAEARKGRSEDAKPLYRTLIRLPAVSEYDFPPTLEVVSLYELGKKDSDFVGICKIGGYARSFNHTDKSSGNIESVKTATIVLEVDETFRITNGDFNDIPQ